MMAAALQPAVPARIRIQASTEQADNAISRARVNVSNPLSLYPSNPPNPNSSSRKTFRLATHLFTALLPTLDPSLSLLPLLQ